MLKIAVRDRPFRVFGGDEVALDVRREGEAPHVGVVVVVKVDPTHPRFRGVGGSQHGRLLRHYFGEVSRPMAQAGSEGGEGADGVPERSSDADAVVVSVAESELQGTEQAGGTGDRHRDEPQLSEVGLPLALAHAANGGELGEDFGEIGLSVRGKLNGLAYRVDYPT